MVGGGEKRQKGNRGLGDAWDPPPYSVMRDIPCKTSLYPSSRQQCIDIHVQTPALTSCKLFFKKCRKAMSVMGWNGIKEMFKKPLVLYYSSLLYCLKQGLYTHFNVLDFLLCHILEFFWNGFCWLAQLNPMLSTSEELLRDQKKSCSWLEWKLKFLMLTYWCHATCYCVKLNIWRQCVMPTVKLRYFSHFTAPNSTFILILYIFNVMLCSNSSCHTYTPKVMLL